MSFIWFLQSFPQLASPQVGKLVDRHGTRLNFCIGFIATASSLTCMALVQQDSIVEVSIFGAMIVVMSVGTLLVVVPSMVSGPSVALLTLRFTSARLTAPGKHIYIYGSCHRTRTVRAWHSSRSVQCFVEPRHDGTGYAGPCMGQCRHEDWGLAHALSFSGISQRRRLAHHPTSRNKERGRKQ